ncbi:glycine receptor subunit alpha-3-like isoform X3 [Melanaphis sacchari]|uniref:glycine receptor subunit alpha-3-like isoform X3 n=1 Tax=Melanaphis sacchari TaxID=742174 RepID=UPI000DC14CEB|nr:glycine receptor subunit alpha-3-like isoform X3 [Melanaphis sacchari]
MTLFNCYVKNSIKNVNFSGNLTDQYKYMKGMFHLVRSKDFYEMETEYNKNMLPDKNVDVSLSLHINRISGVDESKEEIALDVFLHVYWEDPRIWILGNASQVELTWDKDPKFWIPDLYIRQLREMKVLTLFQDLASIRLYDNSTLRISIGATIIIKCDMDFVLYPLDVQTCAVDFGSYKYTMTDMKFHWRDDPLIFPSDFGDGFRLPRYVVSFVTDNRLNVIYYGDGNHSTARLVITLSRELRSHLLESYLPSTLFVVMSWGSFVVMPEVVPGRMVLLVTTLLSLVTMFDTIRNNSPSALELKCIEVWLISCTLFVFLALVEYFIVLFGMRYDKHWRHKKHNLDGNGGAPNRPSLFGSNKVHVTSGNDVATEEDSVSVIAKAQHPTSQQQILTTNNGPAQVVTSTGKLRFRLVAKHVILYCGSPRGILDQVSLALFPLCFILFSVMYWISYITESRRKSMAAVI